MFENRQKEILRNERNRERNIKLGMKKRVGKCEYSNARKLSRKVCVQSILQFFSPRLLQYLCLILWLLVWLFSGEYYTIHNFISTHIFSDFALIMYCTVDCLKKARICNYPSFKNSKFEQTRTSMPTSIALLTWSANGLYGWTDVSPKLTVK